jgi:hypothetical protein
VIEYGVNTANPTRVTPVLGVDFNQIGAARADCEYRRCLPALTDPWSLVLGQRVLLRDADGNECYGRVRAMHHGWAEVHAHFSTWRASS